MIKLYSKINCGLGPAMQKWGRGIKVPVTLWNLISMIKNGQHMLCEDAFEELYTSCLISKQNEGLIGIRPQLTPLNG